ncbi:hypothetical protein L3V83_02360 [Thiotrichales bacterium 19X7-9]|nr:hypothetical protein [Thiotrichales bacterium 19X7-9]
MTDKINNFFSNINFQNDVIKYAKLQHLEENFQFILESKKICDTDNANNKNNLLEKLYNTYLSESAIREVNISSPLRKQLLEGPSITNPNSPSADLKNILDNSNSLRSHSLSSIQDPVIETSSKSNSNSSDYSKNKFSYPKTDFVSDPNSANKNSKITPYFIDTQIDINSRISLLDKACNEIEQLTFNNQYQFWSQFYTQYPQYDIKKGQKIKNNPHIFLEEQNNLQANTEQDKSIQCLECTIL